MRVVRHFLPSSYQVGGHTQDWRFLPLPGITDDEVVFQKLRRLSDPCGCTEHRECAYKRRECD